MSKCKTHTRIFTWLQAMKLLCHGKPRDRRAQGKEMGLLWVSTISLQQDKFAYSPAWERLEISLIVYTAAPVFVSVCYTPWTFLPIKNPILSWTGRNSVVSVISYVRLSAQCAKKNTFKVNSPFSFVGYLALWKNAERRPQLISRYAAFTHLRLQKTSLISQTFFHFAVNNLSLHTSPFSSSNPDTCSGVIHP